MKNLVYVSAIALMGLAACGAPAEQKEAANETSEEVSADTTSTNEMESTATVEEDTTSAEEATE